MRQTDRHPMPAASLRYRERQGHRSGHWMMARPEGGTMYLAKFFHRPPGNDDRELLLIFDGGCGESHAFMGFVMNGRLDPYVRCDFASAREAVAAFRAAAEELAEAGYVEAAETRYTLRSLPANPKPKPAW